RTSRTSTGLAAKSLHLIAWPTGICTRGYVSRFNSVIIGCWEFDVRRSMFPRLMRRRPVIVSTPHPNAPPARSSRGEEEDIWFLYQDEPKFTDHACAPPAAALRCSKGCVHRDR